MFAPTRSSVRASLSGPVRTVKEYRLSACAFLNWLAQTDQLAVNPLAKVDKIDLRGKQVRASRTYIGRASEKGRQ